jgi:transcriptional regulator with XRE-family HTH domain
MKELTAVLARNVRRLRQDRGLTAAELAARSGVAKATLSQIEAARGNPRLETLRDLSDALGVSPTELLAEPDEPRVRVVRRDEGVDITDSVVDGRLVRAIPVEASVIELYELELRPDVSETSASHGVGAHEHVFVLDGSVEVGPVEALAHVQARDLASYPADRPHTWRTAPDEHARVLVLQIMPRPAPPPR